MKTDEQLIWEQYTGSWIIETVEPVDLFDGEYFAKHYGYTLEINGRKYKTKTGIRSPNFAPAKYDVTIEDGVVTARYSQ